MKHLFLALTLLLVTGFHVFAQAEEQAPPDAHLAWTRDNTHAHVFWEAPARAGQEAVMRLEFMNGNLHQPTHIDAQVGVELWMPMMGHGSSPALIEQIPNADGTVYRVSKLFFVMEGDWEVRVTLTYPDGTSETKILNVTAQ